MPILPLINATGTFLEYGDWSPYTYNITFYYPDVIHGWLKSLLEVEQLTKRGKVQCQLSQG